MSPLDRTIVVSMSVGLVHYGSFHSCHSTLVRLALDQRIPSRHVEMPIDTEGDDFDDVRNPAC